MPEDVRNVVFSKPPIGKRGYDEEEVDAFLGEVEGELGRLREVNRLLREQARSTPGDEARELAARLQRLHDEHAEAEDRARLLRDELDQARAVRPAGPGDGKVAAILERARRAADEHVREVRRDADALLIEARNRADDLLGSTLEQAEQRLGAAREAYDTQIAALEDEVAALKDMIGGLTDFGQHYFELLREEVERRFPEPGNPLMPEPPRPLLLPA